MDHLPAQAPEDGGGVTEEAIRDFCNAIKHKKIEVSSNPIHHNHNNVVYVYQTNYERATKYLYVCCEFFFTVHSLMSTASWWQTVLHGHPQIGTFL